MSKDDMWPEQPAPQPKPVDSLEEKLREILEKQFIDGYEKAQRDVAKGKNLKILKGMWFHPDTLAQIKTAFTDEGYFKIHTIVKIETEPPGMIVMSGQEWYDRFVSELELVTERLPEIAKGSRKEQFAMDVAEQLNVAAKRAAGIEENK